jgi:hypothetical protein
MTRRRKSLLIALIIVLIVFLLSQISNGQTYYQIESVSGYGYRKSTSTHGFVIILADSSVVVQTEYDRLVFNYKLHFIVNHVDFYELDTLDSWSMLWIQEYPDNGTVTLNRRYRTKPEERIRYRFKKRL